MKLVSLVKIIFIIGIIIQSTESCLSVDFWEDLFGITNPSGETTTKSNILSCGQPEVEPSQITRIINGYEATPNSWPYIVSLGSSRTSSFCGGVLIDSETVVTAAHCIILTAKEIFIYVGIHDLKNDINSDKTYRVKKITIHEQYNSLSFRNDIAIIKLEKRVQESRNVKFICLNRDVQLAKNESVVVIGWGKTESGSVSTKLMQVTVPINDDKICSNAFSIYDSLTQICSGDINKRKDSCQGDSGGPLMKKFNGKWTLVGVVSYGDQGCYGYGVYTKVTSYYDWIMKNI